LFIFFLSGILSNEFIATKIAEAKAKLETKMEDVETKEEKKEEEEEPKKTVDTKDWTPEDWMLAELRYELHLLTKCFETDVESLIQKQAEDRAAKLAENKDLVVEDEPLPPLTSFTVNNLDYYYKLYASRALIPATWGVKEVKDICNPIQDTIMFDGDYDDTVTSKFPKEEELFNFLKLTEIARRDRRDRSVAGDEKVGLLFTAPAQNERGHRDNFRGGKGDRYDNRNYGGNYHNRDDNRGGYGNRGNYGKGGRDFRDNDRRGGNQGGGRFFNQGGQGNRMTPVPNQRDNSQGIKRSMPFEQNNNGHKRFQTTPSGGRY
jgi:hypothetical protein